MPELESPGAAEVEIPQAQVNQPLVANCHSRISEHVWKLMKEEGIGAEEGGRAREQLPRRSKRDCK
jgi:hypothetical protein